MTTAFSICTNTRLFGVLILKSIKSFI